MLKKLTLIFSALIILFSTPLLVAQQLKNLEYDDIYASKKFSTRTVSELKSMNNGSTFSDMDDNSNIIRYSFTSGRPLDTLLNFSNLLKIASHDKFVFTDYLFSNDETKILLTTESEAIYRHSSKANYFVYDTKAKTLKAVSANGKQMYATFSPDGKLIAFVRDNNLFLKNLSTDNESAVTTDGKKNEIINGANDWVYEEEFSFSQSYQWSENGNYLAYYRFDESKVKEFTLVYYDSLYPTEERYKYPKAGEQNSTVDIYVYDIATGKKVKADLGSEADQYIPRIQWTKEENMLCVLRLNRHQNKLELLNCNATSGKTSLLLKEESNTYIEINDDLKFLSDKKHFIRSSSKNGYRHLYLYTIGSNEEKQITTGNFDVTAVYGYDEKSTTCYYQSAEFSPMERQVYSISLSGKKKLLSPATGTCAATFSTTYSNCVITHSDSKNPVDCAVYDNNGKKIRTLEDNAKVKQTLSEYNLSAQEFFKLKTSENIDLNGWMIKPSDFNPSKKYPVLVFVYGGPGSQTVLNKWGGNNYLWYQLMAQKGYLIVSVDNRGTPGRGKAFTDWIYKNMGHNEVNDQIELAKFLGTQSYVDKDRIGVFGWSYGGYMTALLMTKGADYFKTGVAVAPVTNWRYYDSIYTERYLQTPQENAKGYDDNSPVFYTDKLKGKLLLIHGLTDDNVHFQNSAELVKALIKSKKQFDSFYYPNQAHSISKTRGHVYEMIGDYISKNL